MRALFLQDERKEIEMFENLNEKSQNLLSKVEDLRYRPESFWHHYSCHHSLSRDVTSLEHINISRYCFYNFQCTF